jgi:hypothetical protein
MKSFRSRTLINITFFPFFFVFFPFAAAAASFLHARRFFVQDSFGSSSSFLSISALFFFASLGGLLNLRLLRIIFL